MDIHNSTIMCLPDVYHFSSVHSKSTNGNQGVKMVCNLEYLAFFSFSFFLSSFNINSRKNVALSQWNLIIITTNLWMTAFLDKVRKVKLAQGPPPHLPLSSSQYINPTFHPLYSLPTQTAIHTRCASHVCFPFSLEHFTCLHLCTCMLCASKCVCTCYSVNHHKYIQVSQLDFTCSCHSFAVRVNHQ